VRAVNARLPFLSTGLMLAVAVAAAGCGGSASSGSGSAGSSTAAASPLAAVKLAAKTASGANSFTGTMNLRMTVKPGSAAASGAGALGNVSMSATFAEQLHPSVLASVDIGTLQAAGQSLPGGLTEIVTPSTLYLKWSFLTSTMHLGKPWLAIPVSAMDKKSGVNLSQIFSQLQSSGPLTETQLLAGATNVHQVGTGTVDGVPVTEYSGTLPLDKGVGYLTGSLKAQVRQALKAAGISTATFTVWIDGQHLVRKSVVTESGKSVTEVITTTITSINQPVNIAIPPASQTTPMPSSALGSGSGI
jgi:hypothetical protein